MQPVGVIGARPPTGRPRSAGGSCVAFDDVVVGALLGKLAPAPPNPTAKAITVAPPNSEIAFLASDFMSFGMLQRVVFVDLPSHAETHTGQGFGRAELGQWIAVSVRSTERLWCVLGFVNETSTVKAGNAAGGSSRCSTVGAASVNGWSWGRLRRV
jgi:hypothetical protein